MYVSPDTFCHFCLINEYDDDYASKHQDVIVHVSKSFNWFGSFLCILQMLDFFL